MSSGDHADSIPLHKTPRTPDRELAQLSIDSAEKSSQLQRSSAEIQAASKQLFVGEDKHMDEDSGSDNEDFTTPPESDEDKAKDHKTEEKLKNTHRPAARLAGNESQQQVEPSLEACFPKPDEDCLQQDVQKTSSEHVTRLVLRLSNNQSDSQSGINATTSSQNDVAPVSHNASRSQKEHVKSGGTVSVGEPEQSKQQPQPAPSSTSQDSSLVSSAQGFSKDDGVIGEPKGDDNSRSELGPGERVSTGENSQTSGNDQQGFKDETNSHSKGSVNIMTPAFGAASQPEGMCPCLSSIQSF